MKESFKLEYTLNNYLSNKAGDLNLSGVERILLSGQGMEPVEVTDHRIIGSVLEQAGKQSITLWHFQRQGETLNITCDSPEKGVHPVEHARLLKAHHKYHGI